MAATSGILGVIVVAFETIDNIDLFLLRAIIFDSLQSTNGLVHEDNAAFLHSKISVAVYRFLSSHLKNVPVKRHPGAQIGHLQTCNIM